MDKNDAVALNRVYEETLAKERRAFRLRETFTLNPKVDMTLVSMHVVLVVLSAKPIR